MSHIHPQHEYPSPDPLDPAHGGHEPHETHDASHGGLSKYIVVFVALCVLTGMSFFTYTDFWRQRMAPEVGWAFMLAVACVKASLVILFFMHLKYEKGWKYVLTIPTAMMAIFLILMLVPDVGMRREHYSRERKLNAAEVDEHHEPAGDPVDHPPSTHY